MASDKRFWVSWHGSEFPKATASSWPWWISGWTFSGGKNDEGVPIFVCAVVAKNAEEAKRKIKDARIGGPIKEWRFCEAKEDDWSPFSDRFVRQPWMIWPGPGSAS